MKKINKKMLIESEETEKVDKTEETSAEDIAIDDVNAATEDEVADVVQDAAEEASDNKETLSS